MFTNLLKLLSNRYFLVTAFFLSWIFFFASNDLVSQYAQNKEYKEMKAKIKFLEDEIEKMKQQSEALKNDPAAIEKYAREHYKMKRPNEEIFVFDTVAKKEK